MRQTSPTAVERHAAAVRARLDAAVAAGSVRRAGPDSVTWKLNREIVVVAGWGRAILLQFAHPLVAAGVAEHSSFRGSPLSAGRRLMGTVGAMLSLTFGDADEMIAAAAGINVIHDRVFGTVRSPAGRFTAGTSYSAHQSDLLRWVHATLLDSIPLTYERVVGPITGDERDRYCAEAAMMEPLLGIQAGSLPRRQADLQSYMTGMLDGGVIEVTDTARALARAVLYPGWSGLLWPAFRPLRLLTIGLLPPAVRDAYGFRWGRREERALARWVILLRVWRRATPAPLHHWPAARRKVGVGSEWGQGGVGVGSEWGQTPRLGGVHGPDR